MFRLFRAFVNGRDLYQQSSVDVLENFKKSLRYSPDNQNGCIACSTHLESPLTEEDWRIIKNFIVEYEIKASITLNRGTAAEITQPLDSETSFSNEWIINFEISSVMALENFIVCHFNEILPQGPSPSGHYYQ